MANHKQAEKRNRQRITRTARARAVKTRVRGLLRDARAAVSEGADDAPELVKLASRMLDRAASKRVLPKKQVARLKSRLAIQLNRSLAEADAASE